MRCNNDYCKIMESIALGFIGGQELLDAKVCLLKQELGEKEVKEVIKEK